MQMQNSGKVYLISFLALLTGGKQGSRWMGRKSKKKNAVFETSMVDHAGGL
jgi:hypothetical protein